MSRARTHCSSVPRVPGVGVVTGNGAWADAVDDHSLKAVLRHAPSPFFRKPPTPLIFQIRFVCAFAL
jgi:hypothetical protein